jgi:hypothetical protein
VPFVLSLERPNGDVLQKIEGTIPVSADGGAFIGVSLINTVFPTEGRYQVKISSAGQTLISHPLHLKKALGASQPVIAGPIH